MDSTITRALTWASETISYGVKTIGQTAGPAALGWLGGRYYNIPCHGTLLGFMNGLYYIWVTIPLNKAIEPYISENECVADMIKAINIIVWLAIPFFLADKYGATILHCANELTGYKVTWLLGESSEVYDVFKGAKVLIASGMLVSIFPFFKTLPD